MRQICDGFQAVALQISGRLGILGVAPSRDVVTALGPRLYDGDHGAHWFYNRAVEKRLRYEKPSKPWPEFTAFAKAPSQSEIYKPLMDAYDTIGGAWWMHNDPLPIPQSGALLSADAAFFLLKMPAVRAVPPMSVQKVAPNLSTSHAVIFNGEQRPQLRRSSPRTTRAAVAGSACSVPLGPRSGYGTGREISGKFEDGSPSSASS